MNRLAILLAVMLLSCGPEPGPAPKPKFAPTDSTGARIAWPADLPVYDHIVIVVEENKDFEQINSNPAAPYINGTLKAEGATLVQMYAEEHNSEGNYFWLFSGSNHNVGFNDEIPSEKKAASNLGAQLIAAGRSFKGYSEGLPEVGSTVSMSGSYARATVPWVSFANVPNGRTVATSSNLRFEDFPTNFHDLPTVAFVIPNLINNMHDGVIPSNIRAGDTWLRMHLDGYYQWAKQHNSLLIVTFDENDRTGATGLTDPAAVDPIMRNRVITILAGARIGPGEYREGKGVTHVNLLRTLEAMYGLPRSGTQQSFALKAGIADDFVITDVFER
ncbi:MAG: acid phosphatase [Proteobacteria bacterium]|nr:MAG: acid phosphatase [Pseudomonadota bacterium]